MRAALVLALSAVIGAASALAEIHECNGTWTNAVCSDAPKQRLPETRSTPRPKEELDREQRETWLTDLELRKVDVSRLYNITIDVSSVRDYCSKASVTLDDCRKKIDEKDLFIDQRISSALEAKAQKSRKVAKQPEDGGGTQINVIQQNIIQNRGRNPVPTTFPPAIGVPTPWAVPPDANDPFKRLHPPPPAHRPNAPSAAGVQGR